jgi:RNA polymerase sigma-70 factor, ECF subfamily
MTLHMWATSAVTGEGGDRRGTAPATRGPGRRSSSRTPTAFRHTASQYAGDTGQTGSATPTVGGSDAGSSRMTAIYLEHAEPIYRFLLRLALGDAHLAQDLLQETMLRAWRQQDVLGIDSNSQRRWLFIVARRVAIDAARARAVRPKEIGTFDLAMVPADDDPFERLIASHDVRNALQALSEDHRRVLLLIYFQRRSTREAADALNIPEGTVKSRTHHALRALRRALGDGAA